MKSKFYLLGFMASTLFAFGSVAKESSKADAKFLDQMTAHHQDAIAMNEMAKTRAASSDVKKMAEKMTSDQSKEIDQMRNWRQRLYASEPKADPMGKMDMSSLQKLSGKDFDLAFLDMMAKHHEEGVKMAKAAAGDLQNSEIKKFANNVQEKQQKEKDHLMAMKSDEMKSPSKTK